MSLTTARLVVDAHTGILKVKLGMGWTDKQVSVYHYVKKGALTPNPPLMLACTLILALILKEPRLCRSRVTWCLNACVLLRFMVICVAYKAPTTRRAALSTGEFARRASAMSPSTRMHRDAPRATGRRMGFCWLLTPVGDFYSMGMSAQWRHVRGSCAHLALRHLPYVPRIGTSSFGARNRHPRNRPT